MKKIALMAALTAFAGMAQAVQQYAAWTKYRDVTINTTNAGANVATAQADFPVLVRLSNASEAAGANVLSEAQAGGADIRFSDSTGTVALQYEIDHWSATSAAIWVRVPSVAGNANTKIRMYWNRSGAASTSGNAFSSTNGFLGVWHMGNSATPTTPRPNAVAGGNPATPVNLTNDDNPFKAGAIGMADTLRSQGTDQTASDYFDLGDGYSEFGAGQVTLSMWVWRTHVNNSWNQFLSFGNDANTDNIWMGKRGSAAKNFTFEVPPPTAHIDAEGALSANEDRWIHLLATNNQGASVLYVDGAQVQTGTTGAPTAVARVQNYIARSVDAWADRNLRGKVDEVRVSNAFRSADWVKLEYETQKPTATAVSLGATQTVTAPALAYLTKSATYLINQAITANTAVTTGTVSGNFTVAPSLPAGLAINASNGTISGTPTAAAASAQYVVTVTVNGNPARDTLTLAVSAGTPPGAPGTPTATGGNAQATVTWSAASAGTAAITSYTVRATQDTTKTCTWTTGPLSCTVTGLTNGTAYTFVVRATSAAGNGPFSAASAAVTPATVPGAPTGVTATQATGTRTVNIAWTAPASTGGAPILAYYARFVSPDSAACFAQPPAVTCQAQNVNTGTPYSFVVRAVNAVGEGPLSAASSPVTVGILPGSFAIQVNGAVKPFAFSLTPEAMASTDALTMTITDLQGRAVWSKTVNPAKDNVREIRWNGTSTTGRAVSAGVYLVRVSTMNGGVTTDLIKPAANLK